MTDTRLTVVLGMHRSGTSAIARALKVMGVDLGDAFHATDIGINDKGYWEDRDIHTLDVEMLKCLDREWHHLAEIGERDVAALRERGYFDRAVALLKEKTRNRAHFAFKDPRLGKLLPFWLDVFAHCRFDVGYVIALRHPLSVASSLAKRDGIEPEHAYLLWFCHIATSLSGSAGQRRVLVDYDDLMDAPERELRRMAQGLGLEIDPAALADYKRDFLDQGLRHTRFELDDLLADGACPAIVRNAYAALLDVAAGKTDLDALQDDLPRWTQEYARLEPTLRLVDKLLNKQAMTQYSVAERQEKMASLHATYASLHATNDSLHATYADLHTRYVDLNSYIATLHALNADMHTCIADRDADIATLQNSLSWRLTAPLRSAVTALQRAWMAVLGRR